METLPVKDVQLEDLKLHRKKQITTFDFYIYIKVPASDVQDPVRGQGLSTTSVNSPRLKDAILSCTRLEVVRVLKKVVILKFTVSEKYLNIFHTNLRKMESAVLIKGETYE